MEKYNEEKCMKYEEKNNKMKEELMTSNKSN